MADINFHFIDCNEFMNGLTDKQFDLAICDPMYDLNTNFLCPGSDISTTGVKRKHIQQARELSKLTLVDDEYFRQLNRVSNHQIVWGENYFNYNNKPKGRIIWDKVNDSSTFSNAEIASCSMIEGIRIFRFMWNGMLQQNMKNKEARIHPFQKPVALYRWLLQKFGKPGMKILDTHGGSMSLAIACEIEGFDLDVCENNEMHFNDGVSRFNEFKAQKRMVFEEPKQALQQQLFNL